MITAYQMTKKTTTGVRKSLSFLSNSCLVLLISVLFSYSQSVKAQTDRDEVRNNDHQPKLSLWKVDEAHLANHHHGEAYFMECGSGYYLHYKGPQTSEDIIVDLLNEGDAPLKLKLPIQLEDSSAKSYEIISQPEKNILAPDEETHFIVRYTAPQTYQDDKAKIFIHSNDPQNKTCALNLDVGLGVSFSKVFSPDEIGPGNVSTLTFTISNSDVNPVSDLAFLDALPAGMIIADVANASSNCGNDNVLSAPDGGSTITFSNGTIAPNQSCTVSVDVTSSTPGTHTNTSGDLTSSAGNSGNATDDLTVSTSLPGFSKSFAPSTVPLGDKSTLTLTIDNSANDFKVDNLDFTDVLPAGMLIASPANASTTCGTPTIPPTLTAPAGGNTIILDANGIGPFPAVGAGATCTVTVDVVTTIFGELNNTTELLASFVSSGKASATLDVTRTDIAIQKEFTDDPISPGGTSTLKFTLNNYNRDFPATGVAFTDDLTALSPGLPGLTFSSLLFNDCGGTITGEGGTTIGLTGGTIAPGVPCEVIVSLAVPGMTTPGAYSNTTSTITATVDGSPVVGNMANDILYVEPIPVLTKEFLSAGTLLPDPIVKPGDDVVLRFTVTNTSATFGATNIMFFDELTDGSNDLPPDYTSGFLPFPVSVTLPPVPDPPCGMGSSLSLVTFPTDRQRLELNGGNLIASGTCSFDVTVNIPADLGPGDYLNTTEEIIATVDGATRIGFPASDSLTVIAAPQLTKAFIDDPVAPGETVTLQFTLTYPADATGDATDITFTDNLATTLAGLTASFPSTPDPPCGAGSSLTGSAGDTFLTLAGASLMPGEDCTFDITLNVPAAAAPGSHTNTTSDVSATVEGITATSAPASDDLEVSELVFTKEFIGDPHIAGGSGTLRFTIDNKSMTNDATGIFFSDNLAQIFPGTPDLMITTPLPTAVCGGTMDIIGSTFLFFSGGSVTANSNCSFDLAYDVPAGIADGTYTNVTSSLSSSLGSVSPAIDQITVNSNLIELSKSFTDDPVAPGGTVTLEFTLTNLDPANSITAIAFTDDLDATLSGLTASAATVNTCGGMAAGFPTTLFDYSGGSLAAGASCTISVTLDVPGGAAAGIYTNTTSDVTGTIGGLAVTGDPASDNLDIINLLTFSKSFDGPTTATGTPSLTFTITNPGPNVVSDLQFSDNLEAVLSGLVATNLPLTNVCGTGSMVAGSSTISFTGGSLAAMGGTCSFVVDLQVPGTASAGTYPNTTTNIFQSGLVVANPASADLIVEPPPTFAKVFAPDSNNPGEVSTLTFTIDNSASALAASALDFTDNLPANVVVATPSNASTTCSGGTLTATDGTGLITYTGGSVAAMSSCTVQVDVTSSVVGAYVNTTSDLTSSSGNSGTASDTWNIICDPGYSSSISGTTALCLNESPDPLVTFTFTGGVGPYTFTYNIDGGMSQTIPTTMGNSVTLAHPTSADGVFMYNLLAAVDDNGCPGPTSGTAVITIHPLPTAGLTSSDTDNIICAGDNVTFTATGGVNYDFKVDGGSVQNGASDTYSTTALTDGQTVTVDVTDSNTCMATSSGITTTVNPLPAAGLTSSDADNIICAGDNVTFTATGGVNYDFKVDGGSVQNGASDTYSTTALTDGQTVTVDVTDSNTCMATSSGITTTVNPLPTPGLTSSDADNIICAGDNVTFTATGGVNYDFKVDGSSVQNSASDTYSTTALTDGQTVTVDVTDSNSCTATSAGITTIVNPLPNPGLTSSDADNIICAGDNVTFTASGGVNYDFKVDGASVQNGASDTYSTTTLTDGQTVTVDVTDSNSCTATSAGITTIVNPLPNPGLTSSDADNIICAGDNVTFTASGGVNYDFKVDGASVQNGASDTYSTSTLTDGQTLTVDVTDSNSCTNTSAGITTTVNPLPTATIGGAMNVCEGDANPDITFTGADGTAPYTFTYKINGGPDQMVTTTMGNSVTVSQSTAVPGIFTYSLVSVSDANMCSQTQTGSAVITVDPLAGLPGPISGPMFTCPGLNNVPYEIATSTNTTSYDWTFTDNSVVINGNGTNKVTLDGITVAGTLSVVTTNNCGSSAPSTFEIKVSSPEVCVLADCSRNGIFVDNEILALFEGTDIFKAIETIESDATILSGWFKIFRAGENIDFYPPFTVETGAIFIAEIESCNSLVRDINQKR